MLILSEKNVTTLLRNLSSADLSYTLSALSKSLAAYTAQQSGPKESAKIQQPHRTSIVSNGDTFMTMPVNDGEITAIKAIAVPRNGPIQGAISLFDNTGRLQGLLSAAEITAFRTALASMAFVTRCKAVNIKEAVVFGAGKQVEWHVRLLVRLVPSTERVIVVNRSRGRLDTLRSELSGDVGNVKLEYLSHEDKDWQTTLDERLHEADLICGCTPSTEPLFPVATLCSNLPKARIITLIGSYKPHMQEVDTDTIKSAHKIFVDSREACGEEAGELIRAKIQPEEVIEIGELVSTSDKQAVEKAEPGWTIFKCVGLGIMDLVTAKCLLEFAQAKGIGSTVDEF